MNLKLIAQARLMHEAPRCSAKSKRSGRQCQAPALRHNVCRCHGARGGAPTGERNGRFTTGAYTNEARAMRRRFADLMREAREAIGVIRREC